MTHGHGQQCGDCLGAGGGLGRGGQRGKKWDNCNRTIIIFLKFGEALKNVTIKKLKIKKLKYRNL